MSRQPNYPEYVSISTLSKMLNISQTIIEIDFKTYKIKKFLIENQNGTAKTAAYKRILRSIDRLNDYARNNINTSPYHLFAIRRKEVPPLSVERQEYLNSKINSEDIFKLWLAEYGFNINHFKLVIPSDEAVSYEKYLKNANASDKSLETVDTVGNSSTSIKTRKDAYSELCESLKNQGRNEKQIAKELKKHFPEIKPSRIGRLLPANPGANITPDAHRKRGERLLAE